MAEKGRLAAVELEDRGFLRLGGPETRQFLQGLVSNDVGKVTPDHATHAALLTPQGKYLFDFFLYDLAGDILLETEAGRLDDLARRLLMYRLRAKVEITPLEDWRTAVVFGEAAQERFGLEPRPGASRGAGEVVIAVDPRHAGLGVRVAGPGSQVRARLRDAGLPPGELRDYDRLRIALAVPDGSRDLQVQKSILLESNFDELNGVAFDKGCFIGQELTARTKHRGLVKKRLVPVRLEGGGAEPGALIMAGEKEAGELRSTSGDLALALMRLDYLQGPEEPGLRAGEAHVRPLLPDWLEPVIAGRSS
jgi:folate-binding protein YgfZ